LEARVRCRRDLQQSRRAKDVPSTRVMTIIPGKIYSKLTQPPQ
jgi:hypothetical protein